MSFILTLAHQVYLVGLGEDKTSKKEKEGEKLAKKWVDSNRWLVLINPAGCMTCMRASRWVYMKDDFFYRDYRPFCQIKNATKKQIEYAMKWAVKNLGA